MTKTETKHTPPKWSAACHPQTNIAHGYPLFADGGVVARFIIPHLDMEHGYTIAKQRAERAAACWNACEGINPDAVPDLLAACKAILADLREARDTGACSRSRDSQIAEIATAIRKAEGTT